MSAPSTYASTAAPVGGESTPSRSFGERRKFRRNRQIQYPPGSVKTDGVGNIISRPLTKHLQCFADPVEWQRGFYDQPRQWGDKLPEPRGCAMCPVKGYCQTVALERITTCQELAQLHDAWEQATIWCPSEERYQHVAWAAFVEACEKHSWGDCNVEALERDNERRTMAKIGVRRGAAKKKLTRQRSIPAVTVAALEAYRDARVTELLAAQIAPSTPLWLRNREPGRCVLIADAWRARELLRLAGRKASGRAAMEWLKGHGRLPKDAPARIVKSVEEALRRADQLLSDGSWPPFTIE
jgi:hypothetical protein